MGAIDHSDEDDDVGLEIDLENSQTWDLFVSANQNVEKLFVRRNKQLWLFIVLIFLHLLLLVEEIDQFVFLGVTLKNTVWIGVVVVLIAQFTLYRFILTMVWIDQIEEILTEIIEAQGLDKFMFMTLSKSANFERIPALVRAMNSDTIKYTWSTSVMDLLLKAVAVIGSLGIPIWFSYWLLTMNNLPLLFSIPAAALVIFIMIHYLVVVNNRVSKKWKAEGGRLYREDS